MYEENSYTGTPFLRNSTWIDRGDKEYKKWLGSLDEKRAKEVDESFKRLERINRGTHNGTWRDKRLLERQDDWYLCHAVSCQTGLTKHQKRRVCYLFDECIDMRSYRKFGESKWELVAFCLCVLIHNESQPIVQWKYYPGKSYEKRVTYAGTVWQEYDGQRDRHELLDSVANSLQLAENAIRSCLEMVRRDVPLSEPAA